MAGIAPEEMDEISNLQEQMLLSFLSNRVNDLPVRRNEMEWERKRSESYSFAQTARSSIVNKGNSSGGVDIAPQRRRRVPMMQRKKQPNFEEEFEAEEEKATKKDKEELRRLRKERQKRRKARLGQAGM